MKRLSNKMLALNLFNESAATMTNLAGRWYDEKEYEDIADYKKPLETFLKKAKAVNVKMTKRPFGFTCQIGDAKYQFSHTMTQFSYTRWEGGVGKK